MATTTPSDGVVSPYAHWYPTWRNHILHSSFYAGIIAVCWRSSETLSKRSNNKNSSSNTIVTTVLQSVNLLVGAIAAYCLKDELAYMRKRRLLPPGDSGIPIVGHLPLVIKDSEARSINAIRKYGPMYTYNLLMNPFVVCTKEADVRWATSQERRGKIKGLMLPHFMELVGEEAILFKSGHEHKRLRKIFEPAFSPMAIRDYAASIDMEASNKLKQWSDSGDFQSPRQWAMLTMRIFFVCAFGEAEEERMKELTYLFENWLDGFNAPIPLKIPGTALAKAHKFKKALQEILIEMINEFKETNPPDSPLTKKSVMGRLCYATDENGNLPSEKVLVDNLYLFIFAGFDTTKGSFGGFLHFLNENPRVQELLVEEVKEFDATVLDVDQLKNGAPILNAFLAESWRLTAPLTSHATITTEALWYKEYFFPKGTHIEIDIQAHAKMNDELYPDAENFCFERWLPKDHPLYDPSKANTTEIDYNVMNSKFRTFNHGAHACLGGHFAKLQVRIILTRLLQSYKLEVQNDRTRTFPMRQFLNDFKLTKREAM
mmetsp:Transcript_45331/g.109775  ORF Transcript_45331/g.109775 Transcript_45331/m.109775 type:complete len:544 (-) Transcript_45331:77-1708(-)